ncbi:MAG: hypothetical protein QOG20_6013 [Pseudonocardiales bacterium]|jgi:hypothetical protein|nr:hypothetical protein [Pseudonocardiales bacterium]
MNEQDPLSAAPSGTTFTPDTPVRRPIARFQDYADAERAVDTLTDKGFPVERVAIVGRDLELVEQVTGRLDYPRAALRGAASGAVTGALIGWIFGLVAWFTPLIAWLLLAVYGLVFGAIVGALIGLLVHWMQRGRRDFASTTVMRPREYELMVDEPVAAEATRLLGLAA